MKNKRTFWTIGSVKNYFEKAGCELLDTKYDNTRSVLRYRCLCGNIAFIKFYKFAAGHRCKLCKSRRISEKLKGHTVSKESRLKISIKNKSKKMPDDVKLKISLALKGKIFSDEHKKKISETRKKLKIKPWNVGKRHSLETIQKMKEWSIANKDLMASKLTGHKSSLKGTKISSEHRAKIKANASRYWLGKHQDDEIKSRLSSIAKERWKNDEYVKMQIKSRLVGKNKAEAKLETILGSVSPGQWKFVGNGDVVIAGKCPDFININGQKKIIELFGDYWHKGQKESDRAACFSPYGYDTLVIWERELKDIEQVKNKIIDFANKNTNSVLEAVK